MKKVPSDRARLSIREEADVVIARRCARDFAKRLGLRQNAADEVALAVSELARNVVVHARDGELLVEPIEEESGRRGVRVIVSDRGPGIVDCTRAMEDGYSTAGSLGLGLPSARRLSDSLELVSEIGRGTTVTLKKWVR